MMTQEERIGLIPYLFEAYDRIREGLTEYFVASLKGDEVRAREELLDCFAVLRRVWERITAK